MQVGKLELPMQLLQSPEVQAPFIALFCLSTEATGAGAIKARSNLQRTGLAP
jgi:hypothetical protein